MKVDISFDFAKVYDIERADVVKGQKFVLLTDWADNARWFADNDAVLSLNVTGANAALEATAIGTSIILIMGPELDLIKKLTIQVVDEILEPAKELGATAEAPVSKT